MCKHKPTLFREGAILLSTLLVTLAGCGAPEAPISYPCKHPDPDHIGPDGKLDPCHLEDPDSPAHAVTAFFSVLSAPFCEALYTCCNDQMFLQDFGGSTLDGCKAKWIDGAGLGSKVLLRLKASLVDGQTVFDPAQLDACITRLNARIQPMGPRDAACIEPSSFLLLNTCLGAAFRGQLAPGETCDVWPGLPEDLSFAQCKDGRCLNGKCSAFAKTGEPCLAGAFPTNPPDVLCNFVQGEWCHGTSGIHGTCGPRLEIGATCDPGRDDQYLCKSLDCSQEHLCDPLTIDSTACDVF